MSLAGFESAVLTSERLQTHSFNPRNHWDRRVIPYGIVKFGVEYLYYTKQILW